MKFSSVMVILYLLWPIEGQRLVPPRSYHSDDDDDDEVRHALDHDDEEDGNNSTDKGLYVGAPCEIVCNSKLLHVYCNPITGVCECEKNYPVKLNPYTGCGKPKRLGEQCYYRETCQYTDVHSACVQVHHNAICQCQDGYHSVSIQKPSKRVFCAEDLEVMTTDFSTFAGVLSGIAILSGLICFVLHLFNQNMYGPRRHRFGNANLAPPILFSSDPGSRRPSLTSIHSGNSIKSYSQRRYERERELKEEREMQRRLARMSSSANSSGKIAPTPSPHSTDDLLPTLEEDKQVTTFTTIPQNRCFNVVCFSRRNRRGLPLFLLSLYKKNRHRVSTKKFHRLRNSSLEKLSEVPKLQVARAYFAFFCVVVMCNVLQVYNVADYVHYMLRIINF
ncbi:uncharacterized protein LOC657763 isoform X8 [Tribolium castaneum]|uniref:uncharacterized protein LOC657763 isoform X8 n=1 Tax=Tribolium castaneum TaxID=7070 RepID=UPI00046C3006|nr:PREDICTED: uncharacterized protein LOC657763 isoform X8 [Tribolium castaneum]|eukprot:XP_008199888.1 PREDICTED: uncharacterized protein LOC657763 isoform X8 [Tribolium castaneum]